MRVRAASFAALLLLAGPVRADDSPAGEISAERLTTIVKRLSGPEFSGRGFPGDREKTAMALGEEFRKAGAAPAPGQDEFLVRFPLREGRPAGTNVAAWIAGETATEHVLVAAHFDHRAAKGPVSGGADAATGAAALVEVARALSKGPKPKRSVLLVAFDLSEDGQHGTRAYADAPAVDLKGCIAVVAADRLGRSLGDAFPGLLLVHGTERAEGLAAAVAAAKQPAGIDLRRLGLDLHAFSVPDTIPFEEMKIPALLLTAGWSRDDGRAEDTAEKIDGAGFASRTTVLLDVVRGTAGAAERPAWIAVPAARIGEVEDLLSIVKREGGMEDKLQLSEGARLMRKALEAELEAIVKRGKVTAGERVAMKITALDVLTGMVARSK